jgi:D-alanine-D-alanine ligase
LRLKNIAILTGGPSAERIVSERSAQLVSRFLDRKKYTWRVIKMESQGWIEEISGASIDLNDFSLTVGGTRELFDFVFLMIHGTPAEDGKIQGYFEMLGIPHSTCDTLTSALTFNKQKCKDYLKAFDIPLAPSVLIRRGDTWDENVLLGLGLPLFVKPNCNGSSYGVSKVKKKDDLIAAIEFAFNYDDEVVVEAFLKGREFGCGVIQEGAILHAFPITEIIPEAEFFTYEAKYEGASEEITPAQISEAQSEACKNLSKKLYQVLSCRGVVRFDFILVEDIFYLLEANTIPGMSEASIVPKQAIAYGWSIEKLLDVIINNAVY